MYGRTLRVLAVFRACNRIVKSRVGTRAFIGLCLLTISSVSLPAGRSPVAPPPASAAGILPDESGLEDDLFKLINRDRAQKGLSALRMDSSLARSAREQSRGMAAAGYISHALPSLGGLDERLDRAGYGRRIARENVARAHSLARAESILAESTGHAQNLLATDVTHVGVGVVREASSGWGDLYITQIFALPLECPPPAAVHEAFLHRVEDVRRVKGMRPLRLDPSLGDAASQSLEGISVPFDRDAFQKDLSARVSALRCKDLPALSRVTVDVQFLRDARDLRVPEGLGREGALVLGVGVRETRDNQNRPVVVMLSLVGSTD